MVARTTARLYFGFEDTNSVKLYLKTMISASPIGELTVPCKDIGCVTILIEELNITVEPDPKGDLKLRQKRAVVNADAESWK